MPLYGEMCKVSNRDPKLTFIVFSHIWSQDENTMGIIIFVTLFFAFSLKLLLSSMLNLLIFLFRENLLSLDLCYNYISNLKETVTTLALLPKLRNLLLKGNPVFVSRVRYLIYLMYLIWYMEIVS